MYKCSLEYSKCTRISHLVLNESTSDSRPLCFILSWSFSVFILSSSSFRVASTGSLTFCLMFVIVFSCSDRILSLSFLTSSSSFFNLSFSFLWFWSRLSRSATLLQNETKHESFKRSTTRFAVLDIILISLKNNIAPTTITIKNIQFKILLFGGTYCYRKWIKSTNIKKKKKQIYKTIRYAIYI